MIEIYNILEELRQDNSSNYKIKVLEKYKDNEDLKKFFKYTYDNKINYWITKLPNSELSRHYVKDIDSDSFYKILDRLKNREITGNDAKKELREHLSFCGSELYHLYDLVISRDIKCNVGVKIVNEVFDNLIPEVPYMRCSTFDKGDFAKIFPENTPAIVQKKADGIFSYIIKENGNITCLTRAGTEWTSARLNVELQFLPNDTVLVGEALVKDGEKELDRKTGNGLINSFIKRLTTIDSLNEKIANSSLKGQPKLLQKASENYIEWESTENNLHFEVWDMLTLIEFNNGFSKIPYKHRLFELKYFLPKLCTNILSLSEYELVENKEEALLFGQKMMNKGYEGAILKSPNLLFENKTSRLAVKIKAELDCDLKVIGYEMGTGKYENMIGSLICESADGDLTVNVGTGLTDKDRNIPFADYLGKIVTIKYNERIKAKDSSKYSLFLPVFIEIREDKTEADRLEDIK